MRYETVYVCYAFQFIESMSFKDLATISQIPTFLVNSIYDTIVHYYTYALQHVKTWFQPSEQSLFFLSSLKLKLTNQTKCFWITLFPSNRLELCVLNLKKKSTENFKRIIKCVIHVKKINSY